MKCTRGKREDTEVTSEQKSRESKRKVERETEKEREQNEDFWHQPASQHSLEETQVALSLTLFLFLPKGLGVTAMDISKTISVTP